MQLSKIKFGLAVRVGGQTGNWFDLDQPQYKGWTAELVPGIGAIKVAPKNLKAYEPVFVPLVNVAYFISSVNDQPKATKTQSEAAEAAPRTVVTRRAKGQQA